VNFNDTSLWGSEEFGSGSVINVKLEFCKEENVPAGVECLGVNAIYNWFDQNGLKVFGAYNLMYVDFNNYTHPIQS
jgi:hypothetical protein